MSFIYDACYFSCRHINTVYFVRIYLVLYTNTHSPGYSDQITVIFIIYPSLNSSEITGGKIIKSANTKQWSNNRVQPIVVG